MLSLFMLITGQPKFMAIRNHHNNKQHAVDFPFFFGGDFLIAMKKDTWTSVDWKNNQLNFGQGEPYAKSNPYASGGSKGRSCV